MIFRVVLPICLLGLLLALAVWFQDELTSGARARSTAARPKTDGDLLQLVVGGDHPRLVVPREPWGPQEEPKPRPSPEPAPRPPREEPPERRRWVELQKGETIYAVCLRVLGDGSRLREVLELNGLTEEQARRLRPGKQIYLP